MPQFQYYCYRCGSPNKIEVDIPKAPDYAHVPVMCSSCGDGTNVLLSSCPVERCGGFVFWINDLAIPDLVHKFARYFVHNIQTLIDRAAMKGFNVGIDTTDKFPLNARCSCGTIFQIEIAIPDTD